MLRSGSPDPRARARYDAASVERPPRIGIPTEVCGDARQMGDSHKEVARTYGGPRGGGSGSYTGCDGPEDHLNADADVERVTI